MGSGIERRLLELLLAVGAEWILYVLLVLSVVSIAIALERIWYFAHTNVDAEALADGVDRALRAGDVAAARSLVAEGRSHVARIALRGLDAIDRGPEAMAEVLAGAVAAERLRLERGLAFLGTLGNNAPFLGLFGTVLGIIRAFRDLSTNTLEGSSAVMAGIAEALVATAVGLFVALPAVATFNAFQRAIKRRLARADILCRAVMAHAKTPRP